MGVILPDDAEGELDRGASPSLRVPTSRPRISAGRSSVAAGRRARARLIPPAAVPGKRKPQLGDPLLDPEAHGPTLAPSGATFIRRRASWNDTRDLGNGAHCRSFQFIVYFCVGRWLVDSMCAGPVVRELPNGTASIVTGKNGMR